MKPHPTSRTFLARKTLLLLLLCTGTFLSLSQKAIEEDEPTHLLIQNKEIKVPFPKGLQPVREKYQEMFRIFEGMNPPGGILHEVYVDDEFIKEFQDGNSTPFYSYCTIQSVIKLNQHDLTNKQFSGFKTQMEKAIPIVYSKESPMVKNLTPEYIRINKMVPLGVVKKGAHYFSMVSIISFENTESEVQITYVASQSITHIIGRVVYLNYFHPYTNVEDIEISNQFMRAWSKAVLKANNTDTN